MCGIVGLVNRRAELLNPQVAALMAHAIAHRGPDDSGVWADHKAGIALAHRRLSVLELSPAGHQPMHSKCGRYVLIFNGEIYNHLELRSKLNSNYWNGGSDTETLVEAIAHWGVSKSLDSAVGMFAFALWDRQAEVLTLARDRFGEKPLYYGWQGYGDSAVFLFGSELKALKVHPVFQKKINRDALALFLRHNYIPAPYSIYEGISKLEPGHVLTLKSADLTDGKLPQSKPYWSVVDSARDGVSNQWHGSEEEAIDTLDGLLRHSIKQQMLSDVPLGAFLSGGIDSSTVVAIMQSESSRRVKTFSIGFHEDGYNEAAYAKRVAEHLGTDHEELYVTAQEAMSVIPSLPTIYDEPFADSSQIPTFIVSTLAKGSVTVALTGDAGDELFCGYNRYHVAGRLWSHLSPIPVQFRSFGSKILKSFSVDSWNRFSKVIPGNFGGINFGEKVHKGASVLNSCSLEDLYIRLVSHWGDPAAVVLSGNEPPTVLNGRRPNLSGLDGLQQMMVLDSLTYLPDDILVKVDRAAMGVSLETRVPFLDHRVVEFSWRLPQNLKLRDGHGKWILRQVLNKYVPKNLVERPKMGFGVPIGAWLRGPLREWAESLINESRLRQEGYFHPKLIRNKWNEHLSGKANWDYHLWDILMFQSWLETNEL